MSVRFPAVLQFFYPSPNRLRVPVKLQLRRLLFESVRDTTVQPVEDWAVQLNPDLRRGRFLITGFDLDRRELRSFYLSSARSLRLLELTVKRFALYQPLGTGHPLLWLGAPWAEAAEETAKIRRAISDFDDGTINVRNINLSLGVFEYEPKAKSPSDFVKALKSAAKIKRQ